MVSLCRQKGREREEHHADDDESSHHHPGHFYSFFCPLVEHTRKVYSTQYTVHSRKGKSEEFTKSSALSRSKPVTAPPQPMLRFHQKKTFWRIVYSKGFIFLCVVAVLFGVRATWRVYQKAFEARANVREAQALLEELQERERFLRAELERLNTPRGVEEEIRQKFPVVKEGEEMAVIVDDPAKNPTTTETVEESSFFVRLWNKVRGQ